MGPSFKKGLMILEQRLENEFFFTLLSYTSGYS